MPEYVHALTPIDIPACWEDRHHRIRSRCGEDGPTTLVAKEATCPACLTLAEVARIRTGVERTQSSIGSVAIDLSVYEGRGDWVALSIGQRLEAGRRALEHLDGSIAALETWRVELRAALGVTCRKCHQAFHPADTRFDGRAEDRSTPGFCRSCVDRCHDSDDASHRCVICA